MEMKERHVYRTICFVQSSSDFFLYKIQNDGHHLEILYTRNPPPPPPPPHKKDVLFHQTKISLFNSSCLLLTGNKSNTAGRKSVDLKNKTKPTNAPNLIQDFGLSPSQKAPTRDVITLHIRCSRCSCSIHHTNVYKIATLQSYVYVIFQQNTYKGCVPFGKSKSVFSIR